MVTVQVIGLAPIIKAVNRVALALEGILATLQTGADAATIAAINSDIYELKQSSDQLAASIAAASDPKP